MNTILYKVGKYVQLQKRARRQEDPSVELSRVRTKLRDEIAEALDWTSKEVQTTVENYARLEQEAHAHQLEQEDS